MKKYRVIIETNPVINGKVLSLSKTITRGFREECLEDVLRVAKMYIENKAALEPGRGWENAKIVSVFECVWENK